MKGFEDLVRSTDSCWSRKNSRYLMYVSTYFIQGSYENLSLISLHEECGRDHSGPCSERFMKVLQKGEDMFDPNEI